MAVPYKIWWFPTKNWLAEHLHRLALFPACPASVHIQSVFYFFWNVHSEVTPGLARAFYMNGTFNLQGTVTFSLQGTVTFRLQARATILRERSPGSVTVNGYVTDTLPQLPRAAESTGTGTGPC